MPEFEKVETKYLAYYTGLNKEVRLEVVVQEQMRPDATKIKLNHDSNLSLTFDEAKKYLTWIIRQVEKLKKDRGGWNDE